MRIDGNVKPSSEAVAYDIYFDMPVGQNFVSNRVNAYGVINVTDTGIVSGEDVAGWIDQFYNEVKMDKRYDGGVGAKIRLWDFQTNEIATFLQGISNNEPIDMEDGLFVTTEDQYWLAAWDQMIDWSMIESSTCLLRTRAYTAEGAGATALTAEFYIELDADVSGARGLVEAHPRLTQAGTSFNLKFTDYPCVGGFLTTSAGYFTEVKMEQAEGQSVYNADKAVHAVAGLARFFNGYDADPDTDQPAEFRFPPMYVKPSTTRNIKGTPSETATIKAWPHILIGK